MPENKSDKNPYKFHSIDEVAAAEKGSYVIQVGSELLTTEKGKMAFSLEKAEYLYEQVLSGLREMKKNGSDKEKQDADICLLYLKIYPLRIH